MSRTDRIDGFTASVAIKAPCRMATTANITLSGLQTIDGVVGVADDRVCVKNQIITSKNGIYDMKELDWERSKDFNGNRDIVKGTLVRVVEGTVSAGVFYSVSSANPIIIGSSSISFQVENSAGLNLDYPAPTNLAALKALDTSIVQYAVTLGYTYAGDGGHGTYQFDAVSAVTADDCGYIAPNTGSGRWVLVPENFIRVSQSGCPELSDDGSNHARLLNAAKFAIRKKLPLYFDRKVLVSDTVNWDTRTSSYNDLDSSIPNGSGKYLGVIGSRARTGIFGKASSFSGTTKDVVTLCCQGDGSAFSEMSVMLYQDASVTYATLRSVTMLHIKGSDRLPIHRNQLGGIVTSAGSVSTGAGISLWLEDCMSANVQHNFIVYYTKFGICADGGVAGINTVTTTEVIRVMTSARIYFNYFGGGWPDATSRNECISVIGGYGFGIVDNVFENNSKGRAIYISSDDNSLINNWFEGTYDTILIGGGFGHNLIGTFQIQSSPTNSAIEGDGTYAIGGALAVGAYDATAWASTNVSDAGFYRKRNRHVGSMDLIGSLAATGFVASDGLTVSAPTAADYALAVGVAGSAAWCPNDRTMIGGRSVDTLFQIGNVNSGSVGGAAIMYPSNTGNLYQLDLQVSGTTGGGTGYRVRCTDGTGEFARLARNFIGPANDNVTPAGSVSLRYTELFAANGTVNTSDERVKEQISEINPALLRAWSKVNFCQFKFKDAVAKKGEAARLHIGVIAQQVKRAFESEGLDPFAYGILCYDKWEEEPEIIKEWPDVLDKDGNIVKQGGKMFVQNYLAGGELYSIRYDQALALECAYLRSKSR